MCYMLFYMLFVILYVMFFILFYVIVYVSLIAVCYYHVTYAFQSKSTPCSCLNVNMEL